MGRLNFSWLIENEVAGHAEPASSDDLAWLLGNGIRALVRMSDKPKVSSKQIKGLGIDDMYEVVPDFSAPSQTQISIMVDFIMESVWNGKPVGVSCGAGIGRTGTVLACYLAKRNHTGQGLVIEVRRKRPGAVETVAQLQAVDQFTRTILKDATKENDSNKASGPEIVATDVAVKENMQQPSLTDIMKKWGIDRKDGVTIPIEDALNYLKNIAAERNYGRGIDHADIVSALSLSLYQQMVDLGLFSQFNRGELLLESAAYLHDFGYPPDHDHNINGFQLLTKRLASPEASGILTEFERAIILYCILWHRGVDFSTRVREVPIEPTEVAMAMELASVLRIGDGLCYPSGKPGKKVTVQLQNNTLIINVCPSVKGDRMLTQVSKANQKKDLLERVLAGKATPEITKIEVRRCKHLGC